MKKKYLRLLALSITAVMTFAGCGAATETSTGKEEAASEMQNEGEEEQLPQASDTIEKISDEGITWTVFKCSHTSIGTLINDWNETEAAKLMEEKTGVHLEFITPILGEEDTQLAMMIQSGETPDFIIGNTGGGIDGYDGGAMGLLDDGKSVNLAEHLDELPNFKKQLEASEYRQKEVYTDDGRIPGFPTFYDNDEETEVYVGILIRKDLLDEVGMDIPETYDEWHDVLTAFKEKCGISKPFSPGYSGFGQSNMWTAGYGFGYNDYAFGTNVPFYQKDGKVLYAPIDDTESFKAYLEMMNQWYEEGLIDPDFQSVTDITTQISTYSSTECGSCVTAYSLAPVLSQMGAVSKSDYEYVVAPMPVLEKGEKTHIYAETTKIRLNSVIITNACDNVDLALKYWDQYFTKEASDINCWGVEDVTYHVNEDGTKTWDESITNDPNYNFNNMRAAKVGSVNPGCYDVGSERVSDFDMAADELYRSQGDDSYRISSNVSLTEDEKDTYKRYMTDITTYVDEMSINYIIGKESFDQFDQFVQTIKDMGVQECIDAYQNALDRYNAR